MRYRRLQTLGFVALLATLSVIHCLPTETLADRRRSTTFLAATDDTIWPEWDGVTANPELTDAHPTTGWPRDYGRICVTFTAGPSGEHRAIIDGRTGPDDPRPYLSVVDDGRIRFGIQTVGSIADGEVIPGKVHTACVDRSYGPRTSLYLDGRLMGTSTTLPAWDWHPTARLGSRYGDADPLGGEIKSIQWRGLRLACDMRSDTCSDGRKITTTRATPVPCEVSPGVWEMVPENTGCYSVRGLESWAANTSYLSWGAELDRSPWGSIRGGTLERVSDGWRVSNDPAQANSGWYYVGGPAVEGTTYTVACRVRADVPTTVRLVPVSGSPATCPIHTVTPEWTTVSCTRTAISGDSERAHIWPGVGQSGPASVIVAGCWLTKSDTPGRPCWGGEAPVTCAADRHTISTEGWPTEAGEISMVVELNEQLAAERNAWLFDGRGAGNLMGVNPYIQTDGRLRFRVAGTVYGSASPMLTWEVGRPYALRFLRKGGRTDIYRDGALVYSVATPDWAWVPSAHLGMNFSLPGPDVAISIRSLTVRSYEEVSP